MKKFPIVLASAAMLGVGFAPFTAPAKPVAAATMQVSQASGTVTIKYLKGYGIAVWDSYQPTRKVIANKNLKTGTSWKYFGKAVVDGKTWLEVGTSQWIQADYTDLNSDKVVNTPGKIKINYVPNYSVAVWDGYQAGRKPIKGYTIGHGYTINYFTKVTTAAGEVWYRIGPDQWIQGSYALDVTNGNAAKPSTPTTKPNTPVLKPSTPSQPTLTETKLDGIVTINYVKGYGVALWDSYDASTQKPVGNRKLMHGTSWRVVGQVTTADGHVWYHLGGKQWIDGKYATLMTPTTKLTEKQIDAWVLQHAKIDFPGVPVYGFQVTTDGKGNSVVRLSQETSGRSIGLGTYRVTANQTLQRLTTSNTWKTVATGYLK
ncbi:SLAP domain-containing protein [Lacticaseibacillus saniviri]|uniref:Uncharacterized protein n=1 Tax=Lacticaseibacillus saniviri JCM 17471 = DSM 24301 TaxID=1293598 RepID=A0A0R2MRB3_9LACO|nr:SLAP domain-containing protein [Lacticaseibacillus saniviri]KRO16142.1 hypothetical protein IV56_GL001942 [Lacticaseibacillus saniviri JCM 17471 = DSM 24301]MCG4282120.1 SLAP domain-containing protein [Lacticaseibacillus saniviri]